MEKVYRTGLGYDVHKLVEGRDCIIGGVKIDYKLGLLGHSDADVLCHAITDALLGAAGQGDIGTFFPDTDPANEGISSILILEKVIQGINNLGFEVINIDATIMCEQPKINPHKEAMIQNLAQVLNIHPTQIGIKGTTTEKLGFTGRGEGIASQAVATLFGPKILK